MRVGLFVSCVVQLPARLPSVSCVFSFLVWRFACVLLCWSYGGARAMWCVGRKVFGLVVFARGVLFGLLWCAALRVCVLLGWLAASLCVCCVLCCVPVRVVVFFDWCCVGWVVLRVVWCCVACACWCGAAFCGVACCVRCWVVVCVFCVLL